MSDPSATEPPSVPAPEGGAGTEAPTHTHKEPAPAAAEGAPANTGAADGGGGEVTPPAANSRERGTGTAPRREQEATSDYSPSADSGAETNLLKGRHSAFDRRTKLVENVLNTPTLGSSHTKAKQSAVAFGENASASTTNYYNGPGQVPVQTVPFTDTEIVHPHVRTASHASAAQCLSRGLVVTVGRPGSGRRSTAVVLLLTHVPMLDIKVLHGDGDVLQAICDQADGLLEADTGYIVDAGGQPASPQTLDMLAQLAHAAGAFIVVIAEPAAFPDEHLRAHVVPHENAPRAEVFAAHLRVLYAAHTARCELGTCEPVHAYCENLVADPRVPQALAVAPSTDRIVQFARDLVDNVHADGETRDAIIDQWRDLSQLAREILGTARGPDGETKSDAYQHVFRISYALFHLHPLSDVIDAVPLLSDGILTSEEAREAAPPEQVFERDLNLIVPLRMRAANAPVGAGPADGPRRAILVNEDLLPALLKVAWYEYGSLRVPLLVWLDRMLASESLHYERVRVRVAQVVGMLLGHDFDYVYRTVVREWARNASGVRRQCAAWAFEMAATDERLRPRVVARVRDWAGSPSVALQDCAARALGTTVGLDDVGATLRELRLLGGKRELAGRASVASSLAGLFVLDQADPVLDTLAEWHRSDNQHLRRHSVRTMLRVGGLAHRTRPRGRPVLADVAVRAPERRALLLKLWESALTRQETSARAWFLLGKWFLAADGDDADGHLELLVLHQEIAEMIAATPIRDRLLFHLVLWGRRHPESATVQALTKTVAPHLGGSDGPSHGTGGITFDERN